MITASRLAGFCAAHAALSLSKSDGFMPMFAYTTAEDERKLERLIGEDLRRLVNIGRDKLDSDDANANDAVFLYSAQITMDTAKIPAIIIEMRAYYAPGSQATIAVPYTPQSSGKFLIHKPLFAVWKECEDIDRDWALESFFEGIIEHTEGEKVWREAWDPSK